MLILLIDDHTFIFLVTVFIRLSAQPRISAHPPPIHFVSLDSLVGTRNMRSMTLLQVERCSNEPFSTYCVFYKLILRILRILQIVILEYCVYCVFYKLTSAHIAYIAYIGLRILGNIALRCVFYNKPRISTLVHDA